MAILNIPITKAGKGVTIAVDSAILNELLDNNVEAALRVFEEGLKVLMNAKNSKFAAPSKLEGAAYEENKALALAQAEQNLADLKEGKLVKRSTSAAKAAGVDRAVMTEATRLAKDVVKNEIRKAGKKISLVPAKDITAAAKSMVEAYPQFIEDAKAALAERAKIQSPLDIASLISESPTLIAEAEAKKAERKAATSAKQAGKVEKRATAKVPPARPKTEVRHTAH